jgi:hypothetical protein
MQYILLSVLAAFLFLNQSLLATPQEEIATVEQLIETTKKNLENQQMILKLLRTYASAREAYLNDPDSGKLATALVKRAMALHLLLEKEHLLHLFGSDFLSEVAFYNQVGKHQIE